MSRIPPPNRTPRSPLKPTPSTPSRMRAQTPTTPSHRTRTQPLARATTPTRPHRDQEPEGASKPSLSIKEAIALRRAEAKKAQAGTSKGGLGDMNTLGEALPASNQPPEDDTDLLGRLPLRETIEKARSTGMLNLATRSLPCLPSGLFEIHLNITPQPLKSVVNEPKLPAADEQPVTRRGGRRDRPAWFEAQDLTVLKAWNNDITEVQHEISLFGSLKTIDLHKNKLTALPSTFGDLSFLTVIDLSQNQLTSLPDNIWALPELTTLNISHNHLTSLPFKTPFQSASKRTGPNSYASTDFFTPAIVRATAPLPKLSVLNASHNKIVGSAIDLDVPSYLAKFDLSENPLGQADALLKTLGGLSRLRELRFEKAEIGNPSLPPNLFSSFNSPPFPALRILDFSETGVSLNAVQVAIKAMKQKFDYDFTTDEPPEGVARILVGKRVIKEAWEIQSERRAPGRTQKSTILDDDWYTEPTPAKKASIPAPEVEVSPLPPSNRRGQQGIFSRKEVAKEAWELEAEQGLLTEGGKRRARASAAIGTEEDQETEYPSGGPNSINNPQYYTASSQTLKLPASAPAPKTGHIRAFSLASPFAMDSTTSSFKPQRTTDLALPAPTLPLTIIVAQTFADTLKVLILTNRRLDRTFTIPALAEIPLSGFLPKLEELDLEGCNLDDLVTVQRDGTPTSEAVTPPPRANEPLLLILAKLFPSLRTLNLSYNRISDASLTVEGLSALILQVPHRSGLRHLRLRGNKLCDLTGFQNIADMFKGNRDVPEWKMEELDVRDNEIGRLPAELGLLPLDVFLVEGNVFRVPQRRVWEREGTKGLLSWLRGRIE